ncbi:MAG: hypothetical protein WCG27_09650, partial [Pseudomonadota bacterium]
LHLFSVQLHGMSQGVDQPTTKTEKFFPFFIIKDLIVWSYALMLLLIISYSVPFESFFSFSLFWPYDASGPTPDGIKPEWYFFFVYYPMELLPFWVILLLSTLALAVLFMAPWIFRGTSRKTLRILAVVASLYLVVMTLFGQYIFAFFKGA